MEVEEKHVELIQLAILRLIEEKREEKQICSPNNLMIHNDDDTKDHQLLMKLISQLRSLKGNPKQIKPQVEATELADGQEVTKIGIQEIVKELREVKRQNSLTHLLLYTMITITAFWQFSEVSLILALRSTLSHPFKAVGSLISGALRGRFKESVSTENNVISKNSQIECPPIKIPDLPRLELPYLE